MDSPAFRAMSTALCISSSNCLAISLLGWMGFPRQLRGADFQARVRDRLDELVELRLIVKQNAGIAVILAGVTAAADFYHLGAQGPEWARASGRGSRR